MVWGRSLLELKDRDPGHHPPYIPRRTSLGSQVAAGAQTAQAIFSSDVFVVLVLVLLLFWILDC